MSEDEYLDWLLDQAFHLNSSAGNISKLMCPENREYLKTHKERIKESLKKLFPDWQELDIDTVSKESLKELMESLVDASHLVILNEEFDNTMIALIEEQLEWGTKNHSWRRSKIPEFNLKERRFSSAVNILVAKKFAKESLSSMTLKQKQEFFLKHYDVGSEPLDSIPKSKLKKISSRFVRILQDILATWWYDPQAVGSTFLSRVGFALLGFLIIVVLRIFIIFL